MASRRRALILGIASLGCGSLVTAQDSTAQDLTFTLASTSGLTILTGTHTISAVSENQTPTGPYTTYTSKITFTSATDLPSASGINPNVTDITLTGSAASTTFAGNATETSAPGPAQPTNTQPCNSYVEFCSRKYSNITVVGAHNSPFVVPANSASNQQLDVTTQLNDGIRFLQAQMQWPTNGSVPHFCHTTCDLLDAGPITDWLGQVTAWVAKHPYDVVTVLLENGNYSDPSLYVPFIESSGIVQYAYTPPYLPMSLADWPTLGELILHGKRVVMFLDYEADQSRFPWLLDEFSQVWETPFDPMDPTWPCTVQRPPNLAPDAARDRLYVANHNLNAEFNVFGASVLVPAVSLLNVTNGVAGNGSLGDAAQICLDDWGRAPNVLNVDYYNFGSFSGSVFQVAADYNNVTYNRSSCCGTVASDGGGPRVPAALVVAISLLFALAFVS